MSTLIESLPAHHALWRAPAQAVQAFVGLGANLGDARQALRLAVRSLADVPGVQVQQCSALYGSAPIDSSGPDYLNAVARVSTTLGPAQLLQVLQTIENEAGRLRPYRNAPRTLDLDLLRYGDVHSAEAALLLPHPRMHERAFVLLPLHDVAPELVSAQALAAVQGQRIERLASSDCLS